MAIDKEFRGAAFPMVENSMFYHEDEIDDVRLIRNVTVCGGMREPRRHKVAATQQVRQFV